MNVCLRWPRAAWRHMMEVAQIPDHGDLWRVEWENRDRGPGGGDQDATRVELSGRCFSLPLELERRLELQETKNGWRLQLQYKVVNKSSKPVPWSWAAHPLFAVQEGDRIRCRSRSGNCGWRGLAAGGWARAATLSRGRRPGCRMEARCGLACRRCAGVGGWRQTVCGTADRIRKLVLTGKAVGGCAGPRHVRCCSDSLFGFVDLLRWVAGEAGPEANVCGDGAIDGTGGFAGSDGRVVAHA